MNKRPPLGDRGREGERVGGIKMELEDRMIKACVCCLRLILGEAALEKMTHDLAVACVTEAERWEGVCDEETV